MNYKQLHTLLNKYGMQFKKWIMENLIRENKLEAKQVFNDSFLDARTMYLYCFNALPDINYIGKINGEKALRKVKQVYPELVKQTHQKKWFKNQKKGYQFDETLLVLSNRCLLVFEENYAEIYHDDSQSLFIEELTKLISTFKHKERKQPLEINLIIQGRNCLELRGMEIKRTKLDLDLYYEDDFKGVDEVIRKRLSQKNDKGIVLLHGLPGTGKTTYLRYLLGKLKKRVLFLSPSVAGNLMNPDFIELLMDYPNTVLIIEDAENIIMDRKYSSQSSVSNLLNISDGLLADFLNVQLICTFNSSLTMVDSALMRKSRLIAKYEFGKLSVGKARRLSAHLGFETDVVAPMTIAEICHPHESTVEEPKMEVIGFRRREVALHA